MPEQQNSRTSDQPAPSGVSSFGTQPIYAEAMQAVGGWYVFFDVGTGYGSRGIGLTEERARRLADQIRNGEVSL